MKNRRFLVFAFVAIALLCMGIGYSTLVDTLTINGTVGTTGSANVENEEVFNVEFTEVTTPVVVKVGGSAVTATATVNKDTATLDVVNMGVYGEKVTAVYSVKNLETTAAYSAKVVASVVVKDGENVVSDYPFAVSAVFGNSASTTIANNDTAELTVVITMNNQLLTADASYTVTITLSATAA